MTEVVNYSRELDLLRAEIQVLQAQVAVLKQEIAILKDSKPDTKPYYCPPADTTWVSGGTIK